MIWKKKNYLIGKTPEEHRNHHTAPKLSHDIEQTEAPNPHNGKRAEKPRAERVEKLVGEGLRVNIVAERVQNEPKRPKEGDKRKNHSVKQGLLRQHIGQLGVEKHEPNRHRQVDPSLEERDNLCAASFGRHDEHVFGVSEDRIVEEDTEEHEPKRDDLLQSRHFDAQELCRLGFAEDRFRRRSRSRGRGSAEERGLGGGGDVVLGAEAEAEADAMKLRRQWLLGFWEPSWG